MFVVLLFSCLCLLFTFLESQGKMKNGMLYGFILVTILGCIHYNYGNDYMSYYNVAQTVKETPFSFDSVWSGQIYKEPGWLLLNYLFKPLGGFFVMVAVLNLFQNACVYWFIKQNVNKEWRAFAVFIYLFTTSYYLLNFSMMRQGLVVCAFLGMWPLIRDRKFWITLPMIYLLSTIHHSAIILYPFVFWGYIKFDYSKVFGFIIATLYLFLWLNQDFLNQIFAFMMSGELETYYDVYQDSTSTGTKGLGFVLYQIPVIVYFSYFFMNEGSSRKERSLVSLSMIGVMVAPFNQIIQLAGRMGIYFNIYSIFAIPCVYGAVKNKFLRGVLIALYVFIITVDYIRFFTDSGFQIHYSNFHTIFEAL